MKDDISDTKVGKKIVGSRFQKVTAKKKVGKKYKVVIPPNVAKQIAGAPKVKAEI